MNGKVPEGNPSCSSSLSQGRGSHSPCPPGICSNGPNGQGQVEAKGSNGPNENVPKVFHCVLFYFLNSISFICFMFF